MQRKARISAIQAIRSISNWLYWQAPAGGRRDGGRSLTRVAGRLSGSDIDKLRAAAAARKQARESREPRRQTMPSYIYDSEYWIPSAPALPGTNRNNDLPSKAASSESSPPSKQWTRKRGHDGVRKNNRNSSTLWQIPLAAATIAAVVVKLQLGEGAVGELKEHVGGSLALYIVNSSWLPVLLTGVTWYLIGTYVVELVNAIRNNRDN